MDLKIIKYIALHNDLFMRYLWNGFFIWAKETFLKIFSIELILNPLTFFLQIFKTSFPEVYFSFYTQANVLHFNYK